MSASCRAGEQLYMSFSPADFSISLLSLGSPNAPPVCAAWAQDHIRWRLFRSGQQAVPSRGRGGCICANTLALRNDITAFWNFKHGGHRVFLNKGMSLTRLATVRLASYSQTGPGLWMVLDAYDDHSS